MVTKTNNKTTILVVEDEEAIRAGLLDVLVFHGFEADFAAEGTAGLEKALSGNYDLVLLDVMLPGMDGFEICKRIREADREQAIIMLTAKTADEDIIQGLQLGADDYVSKPFSVAQLILRIQAVLRRAGLDLQNKDFFELHDTNHKVEIDTRNLSATINEQQVPFTKREMEVLQYLHAHADRAVSREELLNKLWGYAKDLDIETRTIDIHIAKIRRKIEKDPAHPALLVTVRGAGYRLVTPAK